MLNTVHHMQHLKDAISFIEWVQQQGNLLVRQVTLVISIHFYWGFASHYLQLSCIASAH